MGSPDPSRSTMLRRRFEREMRKRFRDVRRENVVAIITQDVLGLVPGKLTTFNVEKQAWRFQTDSQKVQSYRSWLQGQIDDKILTVEGAKGTPWTSKYIQSAHRKGVVRAYTDATRASRRKGPAFFEGSKAEFLRSAFAQPEMAGKVELLGTRAFHLLEGVTQAMSTDMSRFLAEGLARGDNPRTIARRMSSQIDSLTKKRALVIARTEVIHAHAEGQLDSFEALGETEVGVFAEWSTAGDDRVCPLCGSLEGVVMTIKEARGLLPRHPNCRCAYVPALDAEEQARRREALSKIAASLKAEGGAAKSTWAGKEVL